MTFPIKKYLSNLLISVMEWMTHPDLPTVPNRRVPRSENGIVCKSIDNAH